MTRDSKLLTIFHGLLTLTLLSLLTNCATVGTCPGDSTTTPASWILSSRPVQVKISAELSQECLDNVLAGLDFWQKLGVNYLSPMMVDKPVAGDDIIISNSEPWSPYPTLGSAKSHKEKGIMFYSEIRYRVCDFWVVVHEFGHSLGLIHSEDTENIMYLSNKYQGHNVSEKQLEQIR